MDVAGAALTLGAVLFFAGAANPRLFAVWTGDEAVQLGVIHARQRSWQVTNLLFGVATALTAAGLTAIPDLAGPGGAPLARVAVALYGIAAVLWLASISFRLVVTVPVEMRRRGSGAASSASEDQVAEALTLRMAREGAELATEAPPMSTGGHEPSDRGREEAVGADLQRHA
jgi:hypothetical protein